MKRADLERELSTLGEAVQWLPTPDIALTLTGRLTAPVVPARRKFAQSPWLRVATAALLAIALAAATVPSVRAAVERLLGIAAGERIVRVDRVPRGTRLDLGTAVTLSEARRRATFAIVIPAALGSPDGVRVGGDLASGTVSLLYGTDTVLSEHQGTAVVGAKSLGPGVAVREVRIGKSFGYWIGRGPRAILVHVRGRGLEVFRSALPGAGVLLWDRAGVAMRLETRRPLPAALAIAESIPD